MLTSALLAMEGVAERTDLGSRATGSRQQLHGGDGNFLRTIAAMMTLVAGLWTIRLLFFKGVDLTLGGVRVRSNDPLRPFEVAIAAFVVFALTGGLPVLARAWRKLIDLWLRVPARRRESRTRDPESAREE